MKIKILCVTILIYSGFLKCINKEIENAIINSESNKVFNLVSGIVAVSSQDKEYYIKLANEESTKAVMHFNSYLFKRIARAAVGLTSFTVIGFTLVNAHFENNDDSDKVFVNLVRMASLGTAFLGGREIYKAIIGSDLIKKCKRALAVEALVNRLQVNG